MKYRKGSGWCWPWKRIVESTSLHACGGNARCTTCQVEFVEGEPEQMTVAEKTVLQARGLEGVRLSCQILCREDVKLRAHSRLTGSGRRDAGPTPQPHITPPAEWTSKG